MKKHLVGFTLVLALFAFTACKTAVLFTGATIQYVGCELAKTHASAKGTLLASGNIFLMFSQTTAPSPAQLQSALDAIPNHGLEQAQISALWSAVTLAYTEIYNAVGNAEDKANLQEALGVIGNALVNASMCNPPASAMGTSMKPSMTWDKLAQAIKAELKKAK